MIDNVSYKIIMQIPNELWDLFCSGDIVRKGAILIANKDIDIIVDGVKKHYKKNEIVSHVKEVLEDSNLSEVTAAIENANKAASAANLVTTVSIGIGVGVILAVGVGVYLINKNIKTLNAQIDKSQKELNEIKIGINDIKTIMENKIDSDFTSELDLLRTAIEERDVNGLRSRRDNFIKISKFSMKMCEDIIEKGEVIRLFETFKKYILMYYVSRQSAIRCSILINKFPTAKNYTEESCQQLSILQKKYNEFLLSSSGNVLFDCPVETLAELPTIKNSLRLMSLVLKDNNSMVKQLESENTSLQALEKPEIPTLNMLYLDYENETNKTIF